ncbi:Uncharacterised protein [Vibrio cholerae]|nr:Uncharacterised protein [Vibrio cholerae]
MKPFGIDKIGWLSALPVWLMGLLDQLIKTVFILLNKG